MDLLKNNICALLNRGFGVILLGGQKKAGGDVVKGLLATEE
jgi:hypothetical protein